MLSDNVEVLRPRDGVVVVVLSGEHDLASSNELDELLAGLVTTNELAVVDLTTAEFIDSSTLGVLARAHREAEKSGNRLRLQVEPGATVERILEISGLFAHIERANTRDEALA
jgi:anti-sigma B factor antagonist